MTLLLPFSVCKLNNDTHCRIALLRFKLFAQLECFPTKLDKLIKIFLTEKTIYMKLLLFDRLAIFFFKGFRY